MQPYVRCEQHRDNIIRDIETGACSDLAQFEALQCETIGSSYYYIVITAGNPVLVKWEIQGRGLHFHEEVNHEAFGISEDDLWEAIRQDPFSFMEFGTSRISDHIVTKLRVFYGI
jgi:hypothetical protein